MKETISCPVDQVLINENKARVVAFFILILTVLFLITGYALIIAFAAADFLLRVFNLGKYSILNLCADVIVRLFNIKNKPADRAPKRFAAGTGAVFSVFILIAAIFNLPIISFTLSLILILFAFLESFVGLCAGCYVYTILQSLRR